MNLTGLSYVHVKVILYRLNVYIFISMLMNVAELYFSRKKHPLLIT